MLEFVVRVRGCGNESHPRAVDGGQNRSRSHRLVDQFTRLGLHHGGRGYPRPSYSAGPHEQRWPRAATSFFPIRRLRTRSRRWTERRDLGRTAFAACFLETPLSFKSWLPACAHRGRDRKKRRLKPGPDQSTGRRSRLCQRSRFFPHACPAGHRKTPTHFRTRNKGRFGLEHFGLLSTPPRARAGVHHLHKKVQLSKRDGRVKPRPYRFVSGWAFFWATHNPA